MSEASPTPQGGLSQNMTGQPTEFGNRFRAKPVTLSPAARCFVEQRSVLGMIVLTGRTPTVRSFALDSQRIDRIDRVLLAGR